ncbi:MAG: DUF4832 domain-containing protein [Bacteroidales bacterium]|nr:DUF4832 domain-containing protein [Bacteroidales bacterium]
MRSPLLLFALFLVSCTCGNNPGTDDSAASEYGKRIPLQSAVTQVQPMTGLVLWTDSKSRADYIQLEYSYMLYNQVCQKQGEFNWNAMDKLLADVASRGHQAVIRFRYTYPGYASAVPDYIKALPGYEARWAKADGRSKPDTEYPDWRCEELQRFHQEFHRRFAERYDKDPRLAFVETGFGHWAEYHVYDGLFIAGQTFPSTAFQREFLPLMDEWFLDTPWLISIDAADGSYGSPFPSTRSLLDLKFGNFDDSFMCEDWDGYNWESWSFFGKERYRKGPAGGEFSYYSSYDQKHCLDAKGMYGRTFEDLAAKVHLSFIIAADQPGKQSNTRLKEASMAMGYHFEIRDFRIKERESAAVLIANTGVAPIYRDAFVEVAGVRGDLNLRTLMPGDEAWVRIPCKASPSDRPSIACDHLVPGQVIQYQADVH